MARGDSLEALVNNLSDFLDRAKPEFLMISGRRRLDVAEGAHEILKNALERHTRKAHSRLKAIVTGCAEGVDMIAFSIAQDLGIRVVGYYTPTMFARPSLRGRRSIAKGPSPLASVQEVNRLLHSLGSPPSQHPQFKRFLELMEGQWQSRATLNAHMADACVGFVDTKVVPHDGTKATLNIFASGVYAYPLRNSNKFDDDAPELIRTPDGQCVGCIAYNE